MKKVSALIVAAGRGTRMKSNLPKQFLPLDDRTVLFHSLHKFLALSIISEIILIVPPEFLHSQLLRDSIPASARIPVIPVAGGALRQESVQNGLRAVDPRSTIVCIHDGVRPLIQPALIQKSIDLCTDYDGAVIAARIVNTLKEVVDGLVMRTLDRNQIWQVQTPQTFRKDVITAAYNNATGKQLTATDDAFFVEALGGRLAIVESTPWNIKITSPDDLLIARALLKKDSS
ncbi:MAG: 2-C-methyl-D-erythritol 4-phosphate cytidylyltransferase [Fidelibacterota bacterium]